MTELVIYPTDDALREHILTTEEILQAELAYPGCIRVYAVGRYHARIDVLGTVWNFSIKEKGSDERELVADYPEETPPLLLNLAWHRAAEAMLAVRRNHWEAKLNKSLRKPISEQDV